MDSKAVLCKFFCATANCFEGRLLPECALLDMCKPSSFPSTIARLCFRLAVSLWSWTLWETQAWKAAFHSAWPVGTWLLMRSGTGLPFLEIPWWSGRAGAAVARHLGSLTPVWWCIWMRSPRLRVGGSAPQTWKFRFKQVKQIPLAHARLRKSARKEGFIATQGTRS